MNYKTIVTAFFSLVFVITALYAMDTYDESKGQASADVIIIDSMKRFGELERPGVAFLHDKHTKAVEKQGKDCQSCHMTEDGALVFKFKRIEDIDKETTLEIYHDNCIGCHEEAAVLDQETGPVECGNCHLWEPAVVASQEQIDFDLSLHHRHIEAADNQCESCHHGYNETSKQIEYTKGQEASCRDCHLEETTSEAVSYQEAAHKSCINCHQQELAKATEAAETIGSVECMNCHTEEAFSQIVQLSDIPRLDRNQPDTTFLKSFTVIPEEMMDAVVFNHKNHEFAVGDCSTCHHETLNSCESCHSIEGSQEGDWVTLAQSMHATQSDRSCIGCHLEQQEERTECAGCHALLPTAKHISDEQSCQTCHAVDIEEIKSAQESGEAINAADFSVAMSDQSTINLDELPVDFVIDAISEEYQGVHFPHQAIVRSMMAQIEGDPLAAGFHKNENAICVGCHHNSQDNLNPPPRCISCHSSTVEEETDAVPGAKNAYHRQCFECHEAMEIARPASTDCIACHEER